MQTVEKSFREKQLILENMDAFSSYEIRVRSCMMNNMDTWGEYGTTNCITPPTKPIGKPGTVQGAYEEIDFGAQREVTLYWKVGGIVPVL